MTMITHTDYNYEHTLCRTRQNSQPSASVTVILNDYKHHISQNLGC